MKKQFLLTVIALIFGITMSFGQSDPTPFDLSKGDYTLYSWDSLSSAGTYPANMVFHQFTRLSNGYPDNDSSITPDGDWPCVYNMPTRARFNGLSGDGILFVITSNYQDSTLCYGARNPYDAVLGLNTLGRKDVSVTFNCKLKAASTDTTANKRQYQIRCQYRIGHTGNWNDFPTMLKFSSVGQSTGYSQGLNGVLPATCENQAEVQVRWVYWIEQGNKGSRPWLTLDDIEVTSNPSAPQVPTISFDLASQSQFENAGNFVVNLTCQNPSASSVSVDVVVNGGTATSGSDYTYSTQTITFAAGTTSTKSVTVSVIDDNVSEADETILLGLANFTGNGTAGAIASTTLTIKNDDDPTVGFSAGTKTVSEGVGKLTIPVSIQNPLPGSATTVDVVVSGGSATSGTDYTFTTTTLTFPAGSNSDQTFDITIIDDKIQESDETIELSLKNASNNAMIGTNPLTITINDNDIPVYTIDQVNKVNASGDADSLNVKCRVKGVVYGPNFSANGLNFVIRDNNSGIGVIAPARNFGYQVADGDEVWVQGTVTQVNGYTALAYLDTVIVNATGKTLKTPSVVTKLSESTESDLIRLNGYKLVDASKWPTAGNSATLQAVNAANDTLVIRIDKNTNIPGSAAPSGPFDVIGLGFQFDPSSPYTEGYQLRPRSISDFILSPVVSFTSATSVVAENAGTTQISLTLASANANGSSVDVSVDASSTAVSGTDFTFTSPATVNFTGNGTQTVTVTLIDNTTYQGARNVVLKLSNAQNATIGSIGTCTLTITDNETNGISPVNGEMKLSIYPNPSNAGSVRVNASFQTERIMVYSLTGQLVQTIATQGSQMVTLSTETLSAGTYCIVVSGKEGISSQLIVIE